MPQADKATPPAERNENGGISQLEGKNFAIESREQLEEILQVAFDYRGDVTLRQKDGGATEGYIFKCDNNQGVITLFVKNPEKKRESEQATVKYDDITSIDFTGEDTAFGKSWDNWMAKSAKQREAEAAKLEQEAEQLGHL